MTVSASREYHPSAIEYDGEWDVIIPSTSTLDDLVRVCRSIIHEEMRQKVISRTKLGRLIDAVITQRGSAAQLLETIYPGNTNQQKRAYEARSVFVCWRKVGIHPSATHMCWSSLVLASSPYFTDEERREWGYSSNKQSVDTLRGMLATRKHGLDTNPPAPYSRRLMDALGLLAEKSSTSASESWAEVLLRETLERIDYVSRGR